MDYEIFLQSVPQLEQRQDSLYDQMKDSIPILNKFGLYDLSDMISQRVVEINKKIGE